MKSKEQKLKEIEDGTSLVGKSTSVVLVNFSKTTVNSVNELKKTLREISAFVKVMKKTLLSIIFKRKNIELDPNSFFGQVGAVFSEKDIVDTAGEIHRFKNSHKEEMDGFNMIAGYDIANGIFYDGEKILELGRLPSRDTLLAQFVGMLSAPMRSFAVVLGQIAEQKQADSGTAVEEKKDSDEEKTEKKDTASNEEQKKEVGKKIDEENSKDEKIVEEKNDEVGSGEKKEKK